MSIIDAWGTAAMIAAFSLLLYRYLFPPAEYPRHMAQAFTDTFDRADNALSEAWTPSAGLPVVTLGIPDPIETVTWHCGLCDFTCTVEASAFPAPLPLAYTEHAASHR